MTSAVFYLSNQPGSDRQPIKVGDLTLYVRVQLCADMNCDKALDECDIRDDGETLMNSHEIDPWPTS
jgi:hypothetical protein